jgi:hypothetical protein
MEGVKAMKLLVCMLFSVSAFAATCTTASLQVYDVAAFSCTEDNGALAFSNFQFLDTGNAAPLPSDNSVTVTPLSDGLEFNAGFAAPSGSQLDATIRYSVSINLGAFTADQLSILGFGASGSGSLDVAETVCVNGAFSANGVCPTTVLSLNTFDNSNGLQASASVNLPAATTLLGIAKDISVSGGTGLSSANISVVDNATPFAVATVPVATVPEASTITFLFIGFGLLALAYLQGRRQA